MRSTLRTVIIAAVAGLLFAATATTAEAAGKKGKKPAKGKAAPAKKAAKAKMAWPAPAPEMSQLKGMIGRWRCKGKFHGMPGFPAHDYKSTMRVKPALDGQWLMMRWEQKKTRKHKHPYKAITMYNYDRDYKRFRSSSFDNMGGSSWARSQGWEGDKWVESGKGRMGKVLFDTRTTITKKGKRAVSVVSEMKGPKGWQTVAEEACKR